MPDLTGVRVMVLPVQDLQGVGSEADVELAYALSARGSEVTWVLPPDLRRALAASPGMDARLEGLPVGMFLQAEVRRIGDPLFGVLRRVGALANAEMALIPVVARHRPPTPDRPPAVEIGAALIAVRTGSVYWFGVVEGAPGPQDDARALASAADALARALIPLSQP